MSDYLGPLTLGSAGTYRLIDFRTTSAASGLSASLEVHVVGASTAALTAAIEALAAELKVGNTYAHYFPLASSPVVYVVTGVGDIDVDQKTGPTALWAVAKFTLALAEKPAGALTTLYSAEAVNAPASLSLAALLGTNPPQLDLTIDDSSGNDMHCILAALAPTAVSDSMWLILASALTWTTMSSGTGADCWGNTSRYTTSASWQTASLDTSKYPAGRYRLYVRAKQSAGTGDVKESQNGTSVAITRTSQHLTVVSDVSLPVRDSASGTAANLTFSVRSDGTNTLTVNAFVLVPLSWGSFSWHHESPTGEIDRLDVGPSGSYTWATGSADGLCDTTYQKGGILVPKRLAAHVGTLVDTPSPTGDTWPSDWYRSSVIQVLAASGYFSCIDPTANRTVYPSQGAIYVTPGEWYELNFTRYISARSGGSFFTYVDWLDVDGNTVRSDTILQFTSTDASPTAVTYYVKAPPLAARILPRWVVSTGGITATWKDVVVRRCPLQLIVVAEEAGGALSSNVHPVAVTIKYIPRYEVSR